MFIGVTTEGFVFIPQHDEVEALWRSGEVHTSGEFAYLHTPDGPTNSVASTAAELPLRGDVIVCKQSPIGAPCPLTAEQAERAGRLLTFAAVARINALLAPAA